MTVRRIMWGCFATCDLMLACVAPTQPEQLFFFGAAVVFTLAAFLVTS